MTTSLKRMPGWAKILSAVVLVLVILGAGLQLSLLPGLRDVFREETHDRTGPTLLKSIQDMSRYDAASGNFQVVVDLEKDTKYLPDAVRGTRTLYVGAGTVDAYVDLGKIRDEDVKVNKDRTSATLRLPTPPWASPHSTPTSPTPSPSSAVSSTGSATSSRTTRTTSGPSSGSPPGTSVTPRRRPN